MRSFSMFVVAVLPMVSVALTEGWTLPPREIAQPDASKAWIVPMDKGADGFRVLKIGGAEGEVYFDEGEIRIVKTNDKGLIRVMPKSTVCLPKAHRIRVSAVVESSSDSPRLARGYLRIGPRTADGGIAYNTKAHGRVPGGRVQFDQLINTPKGRPQLKATQWFREASNFTNELFVGLYVGGAPSVSVWRDLRVDDLRVVEKANSEDKCRGHGQDFASDMVSEAEFESRLAADPVDHVAKVVKRNGYAQLTVDDKTITPILFKGGRASSDKVSFGGKTMHDAGASLLVANVRFGAVANADGPWTTNGFDAVAAVDQVRCAMRTAPDALYMLTLRLDAPIGYLDTRTDEIWRSEKGEIVYGDSVHVVGTVKDPKRKCWPWASYHSKVWRDDVKDVISRFVAELQRSGLSKRIVGVHLGGYHDAQFATAVPDWSEPARKAFAASGEKEYVKFIKRAPMEIQDDFAAHVRKCFGKDIVVFRWCMSAFGAGFCSSHDIREFADSKEIDVIVPQPSYSCRLPGYAIGVKLPFSSLHLKGKLLMHEHDLRTYASWPSSDNVIRDAGLSRARDIDEWRIVDHKTAGQMIARRTGFWYFDMESGWFSRPEIAEDIASIIKVATPLYCNEPDPWRPTAAFVIDEVDLLDLQRADGKNLRAKADINLFVEHIAESGVPFDSYMKGDFDRESLASRYKYVLHYNRDALLKTSTEINAEAKAAGAYVPLPPARVQVDMNGDFISLHCIVPGSYEFKLPRKCEVINLKSGRKEPVKVSDFLPLDLTAGETCWFSLVDSCS